MLRENLYAAYAWRVRHFKDGETNESTIRFTPDGRPYGFVEKLKEDAPGAALDAAAARRIAERRRGDAVERGPGDVRARRAGTGTAAVGARRSHVHLRAQRRDAQRRALPPAAVVAGDRLTGVTHFIKIPEAFTRRYASMRSANELIGIGSTVGLALLYVIGGIGVGLFFMMRRRSCSGAPRRSGASSSAALQTLAAINEFPLIWMVYDTAMPRVDVPRAAGRVPGRRLRRLLGVLRAVVHGGGDADAARVRPSSAVLARRGDARSRARRSRSSGRTVSGYLLVSVFFAYDVVLYLVMTKVFGWWSPAEALVHPDVLATYAPWLSAIANSFQAGFWEEALFRAVPIAGAALIGERFGQRRLFIVIAFVVQAIIFGAGHAPYPNQPAYARPVELIIPSIGFGLLYLYFGLLPGIILHFAFDVVWFALPIFLAKAPGIWFQQVMVIVLTLRAAVDRAVAARAGRPLDGAVAVRR